MSQGTRWVLLKQKKRSQKSHAWAPLNGISVVLLAELSRIFLTELPSRTLLVLYFYIKGKGHQADSLIRRSQVFSVVQFGRCRYRYRYLVKFKNQLIA